jgi:hypothetical protein
MEAMNEDDVRMLCERVSALCLKIERFYEEPDPLEDDPVKVLELIVNDAISLRVDADELASR